MTRTVAWFHCYSGIAGDMALGALLDAGADATEVEAIVRRLPVEGWQLALTPVLRCGLAATRAEVRTTDTSVVRTFAAIAALLAEARLPEWVAQRSLAAFTALATVEGHLHRRPPEQVHFHEVGAVDAIVDVVGTAAALEVLGVDVVTASAVATGTGMVRAAHGTIPNPAPATTALLAGVPTYGLPLTVELTTPTGAALLAGTASGYGPMPAMVVGSVGYGAGARELDGRPNTVQVVIGTEAVPTGALGATPAQPMVVLEANVDDATGEVLADAIAAALAAGAADAWVTPIVMKKGRPAHTVSALVDPALVAPVVAVLTDRTGSLGIRGRSVDRWARARDLATVTVDGLPVAVKVSPGRIKVEHDDAATVARRTGRPLREVLHRAEAAGWAAFGEAAAPHPDVEAPSMPDLHLARSGDGPGSDHAHDAHHHHHHHHDDHDHPGEHRSAGDGHPPATSWEPDDLGGDGA